MDGPDVPSGQALRRRVLGTGLLCLALFLGSAYAIASLRVDDAYLLGVLVLLYLLVARPLLRPVREAMALRRRLAYQTFLDSRQEQP